MFKMPLRRWRNMKKFLLSLCVIFLIYVTFFNDYNTYEISGTINNASPEEVWRYVSDFRHMKLLNPSAVNFEVLADGGNADDWRYSVVYTERLSHWPYLKHKAKAQYIVTRSMPSVHPPVYEIISTHESCFLKGLYCLQSESIFQFKAKGNHTHCTETVKYQCLPFFGLSCSRDLRNQRQAVMDNLTMLFNKGKAYD